MEQYHLIEFDFRASDFTPIVEMVRGADPFVISPSTINDTYDLATYTQASSIGTCNLWALLDNNVLTRACALAEGQAASRGSNSEEALRLTAAIMCFFILGGFDLEPAIAIYEKASRADHFTGINALKSFRVADHIHPQRYADLALGRIDQIPDEELHRASEFAKLHLLEIGEGDFSRAIRPWRINYGSILKAACILRNQRFGIDSALAFINWMLRDSFFHIASALFVLAFFGPQRPRKMIKNVNESDHSNVISGLRNAAWDITYVSQWGRKANSAKPSQISFLCSNDGIVKAIARPLFVTEKQDSSEELAKFFRQYWSNADTKKLILTMTQATDILKADPDARGKEVKARYENLDSLISNMELELSNVLQNVHPEA